MPTIALNDGRKLRALGERHTHAVDANVGDLAAPVAYGEPPINFNRRSLRTNDLAGHDHASGIGPATVYPEALAAILGKLLTIVVHKMVFEEAPELPPLRSAPMRMKSAGSSPAAAKRGVNNTPTITTRDIVITLASFTTANPVKCSWKLCGCTQSRKRVR